MHKRGEALTFAVFGLAILAALGFLVLSVIRPDGLGLRQATPIASTTQTQTQVQTQSTGRVDRNGDPIQVVSPDLCKGRCKTNEVCQEAIGCTPCFPDASGNISNCTCEKVHNCVSK